MTLLELMMVLLILGIVLVILGTVMSVQIWEKAEEDLGDLEDQVERGEFTPLREWLGEHIHSQGRKYTPPELLQRVSGSSTGRSPGSATSPTTS